MNTAFSGNINKKIPNTLDECTGRDNVSTNLWTWGDRVEKFGKIIFAILIVA